MTPFENPEQLRLAAKILETGCKWQYRLGLSDWRESQNVNPANCLHSGYEIRIKPEPKLVQLTAEDVPIGSVIRPEAWLIGFVNYEAVVTNGIRMIVDAWGYDGNIGYISWEQLMNDGWLINRNDGKGWLPCSKEAEG